MAEQLPKWDAVGVEPPTVLKTDGWQPGMKPSAQHMNWLFNRIYKCLEEIQTNGGTEEIQQELAALQALVAEHQAENASLTTKGHVQLSNSTTSTSDTLAATPSAVKAAMDKANEAFTSASNGKIQVRDAITGKGGIVADADGDGIPTFSELVTGVNGINPSSFKSIQNGTTTYASTDRLITISQVDLSKAVVLINTRSNYNTTYTNTVTREAQFYSPTMLRILQDSSTWSVQVAWTVIEFEGLKSHQTGRLNMSNLTSANVTVSNVNPSKSLLFYSYQLGYNNDQGGFGKLVGGQIANSTTLNFSRYNSDSYTYVTWFLVEFP